LAPRNASCRKGRTYRARVIASTVMNDSCKTEPE
jgi:hypothetical protein